MKKVRQTGDYSIYQKRSGRYAIQDKAKKWVNGEEKAKTLLEAGLIKVSEPKPRVAGGTEETATGEADGGEESAS